MPELAASYFVGLLFTLLASLFFYFKALKIFNSQKKKTLQINLKKINQFWSDSSGEIKNLTENSDEEEKSLFLRSHILTSLLFIFMSWFGLFFLLIFKWSMHQVGRSKFERKLFNSPLTEDLHEKDFIEKTLTEIIP